MKTTKNIISIKFLYTSKSLLVLLGMLLFNITPALAQDGFFDPAIVDTPIDGGLSLLVAAGVGFGIKKVRDARRKKCTTGDE